MHAMSIPRSRAAAGANVRRQPALSKKTGELRRLENIGGKASNLFRKGTEWRSPTVLGFSARQTMFSTPCPPPESGCVREI
jgi:hypothetical protein